MLSSFLLGSWYVSILEIGKFNFAQYIQLMRLQKHYALHHFLISDSQSIKSSNPKKWISVLNFYILKMVFPGLLIRWMPHLVTVQDTYPPRNVLKPTTDLLPSFTKIFYSAIFELWNSEGSFTFIYLFVFLQSVV